MDSSAFTLFNLPKVNTSEIYYRAGIILKKPLYSSFFLEFRDLGNRKKNLNQNVWNDLSCEKYFLYGEEPSLVTKIK